MSSTPGAFEELIGNPPVCRGATLTVQDRDTRPADLWAKVRQLGIEALCVLAGVGAFLSIVLFVAAVGAWMKKG